MDILTGLEKQCRTGSDTHSNGRVLVLTVRLCMQAGEWDMLKEEISVKGGGHQNGARVRHLLRQNS